MSVLHGFLLGILQGIAEFLPISSSGHLAIAQKLFGLEEVPLIFDVILHVATLLAVVIFFRRKIGALFAALGRLIARRKAPQTVKNTDGTLTELTEEQAAQRERDWRFYILAVVIATVVTGAIGVVSEKLLEDLPVTWIFVGFFITSFLLLASGLKTRGVRLGKIGRKQEQKVHPSSDADVANEATSDQTASPVLTPAKISWWQAALVGLAQGVGTLPGISRSGSTISASIFAGLNRGDAGEFSFIVSIPAVLGAFLLESLKCLKEIKAGVDVIASVGILPLIVGFFTAFIFGYGSLFLLMKLIKKGRLEWFAAYLIPVGILGLVFIH